MLKRESYKDSSMAKILPPEGEPIADLDKLIHTMGRIADTAHSVDLPQFRYGFHGYQNVTKAVTSHLDDGTFDDPGKMAETMPKFAERSFVPIRRHIEGKEVGAWSPMLYLPDAKKALPASAMVDFLSFHVRYDLPYTLMETNTKPEHKDDYSKKINQILADAGHDLMPQYMEDHPILRRLKLPELGLKFVLNELFAARDEAWKSFEELQRAENFYNPEKLKSEVWSDESSYHYNFKTKLPKTAEQIEKDLREKATLKMFSTNKTAAFAIRLAGRMPQDIWRRVEAAE